ncbi:hypothetical protein LXA43DRAFT_1125090 [Ganoderma leucocontextum]|nr:hypothetical protein LXA43DRAFT_1125090 [Ganoderma leucocontextum]
MSPFDDTLRQEIELIYQDLTLSDGTLHKDARQHLQVLADPAFADLDQPAWLRSLNRFSTLPGFPVLDMPYRSSKLFDALYETGDELGFAAGKRYVSAAVCACARRAESATASRKDRPRRVAEALCRLASAWTAFMLWPFEEKAREERHRYWALWNGGKPHYADYLEHLLQRDDYHCFMSGSLHVRAPLELFPGPGEDGVHGDVLRAKYIFHPPSALRADGMREDDEVITWDILQHYCAPIRLDSVQWTEGIPPEARNALMLAGSPGEAFTTFTTFGWCLHPTQVPNQYDVVVHERYCAGGQPVASPVTFEDHSAKYRTPPASAPATDESSGGGPPRAECSVDVNLPSADLLRVHAALAGACHLSGAAVLFDAIFYGMGELKGQRAPGASRGAFWEAVVVREGRDLCLPVRDDDSDSDSDYVPDDDDDEDDDDDD